MSDRAISGLDCSSLDAAEILRSVEQDFWPRAGADSRGCLLWRGHRAENGYGFFLFTFGGRRFRVGAHQASFVIANGPIQPGLVVMHSCDVRRCISPGHLSIGTPLENAADRVAKGRGAFGSSHGMAKLTEEDVAAVRSCLAGGESVRGVARAFAVDPKLVRQIRDGAIWRHV